MSRTLLKVLMNEAPRCLANHLRAGHPKKPGIRTRLTSRAATRRTYAKRPGIRWCEATLAREGGCEGSHRKGDRSMSHLNGVAGISCPFPSDGNHGSCVTP